MVEAEKDLQTEEKYYIDFKDAKSKGRALLPRLGHATLGCYNGRIEKGTTCLTI